MLTLVSTRRYYRAPLSSLNSDIRRGLQCLCVGNHTAHIHTAIQPVPIILLPGEPLRLSSIWFLLWLEHGNGHTSSRPYHHTSAEFSFPRSLPGEASGTSSHLGEKRPEVIQSAPAEMSWDVRLNFLTKRGVLRFKIKYVSYLYNGGYGNR